MEQAAPMCSARRGKKWASSGQCMMSAFLSRMAGFLTFHPVSILRLDAKSSMQPEDVCSRLSAIRTLISYMQDAATGNSGTRLQE